MARPVPCPGCKAEVSPYEDACPSCGFGVWRHVKAEGDRRAERRFRWICRAFAILVWGRVAWWIYRAIRGP